MTEAVGMGDIHCRICGEPWDAYGVSNGDMSEKEAKAFRMGLGCPCCEGEPDSGGDEPDQIDFLRDLTDPINDDGDPIEVMDRAMAGEVLRRRGLTWAKVVGGGRDA